MLWKAQSSPRQREEPEEGGCGEGEEGRSGDGGVVRGGGAVNDNNNTFYLNAPCRH